MQRNLRRILTSVGLCVVASLIIAARRAEPRLDNELARTPPMGWNNWNNRAVAWSGSAAGMADSLVDAQPGTATSMASSCEAPRII